MLISTIPKIQLIQETMLCQTLESIKISSTSSKTSKTPKLNSDKNFTPISDSRMVFQETTPSLILELITPSKFLLTIAKTGIQLKTLMANGRYLMVILNLNFEQGLL